MEFIDDREVERFYGEYERKSAPPIAECDFCQGEILADGKSYIFSDGRYVCAECAEAVFAEEIMELPVSEMAEILGAEQAY